MSITQEMYDDAFEQGLALIEKPQMRGESTDEDKQKVAGILGPLIIGGLAGYFFSKPKKDVPVQVTEQEYEQAVEDGKHEMFAYSTANNIDVPKCEGIIKKIIGWRLLTK